MCLGVCFTSVLWGHPRESGKMELESVFVYGMGLSGFRWMKECVW